MVTDLLSPRARAALYAALVALVAGYLVGHYAGAGDVEARLGIWEDGSYPAGCLPGWPCDDALDND